jgi:hypothetical protein
MQLPAAQTSLEPQPRRADPMSRRPFMSQNATNDDGSRFASELTEPNACECHPQAPEVELDKLPITRAYRRAGVPARCALCALLMRGVRTPVIAWPSTSRRS